MDSQDATSFCDSGFFKSLVQNSIDCVNILDAGDTFTVTSNDLPIVYSGFAPEQDYSCTATGVTGAVSGTSPAEILFTTALDGVKIVTDLAIGDTLSGTELRLDGQGLTADSAYDLTQHSVPVLLTADTADPGGIFSDLFTMPLTACVVGDHALILSGVDDSSAVTTDTIWYRLNSSCVVTQLSRSGSTLAVKGVETGPWVVAAAMFALLGSALVVGSRRRRTV